MHLLFRIAYEALSLQFKITRQFNAKLLSETSDIANAHYLLRKVISCRYIRVFIISIRV